jgi:hypothetical protein
MGRRRVLILGADPPTADRIKSAIKSTSAFADWEILVRPSSTRQVGVNLRDALGILQQLPALPTHLLAFRPRADEQERIVGELRPAFRFRWLENVYLQIIWSDKSSFITWLDKVLAEEQLWAERIQPMATQSGLLLPQCSFSPRSRPDVWALAEEAASKDQIVGAQRVLENFEETHWHATQDPRSSWVDAARLVFRPASPKEYHGVAPFPRCWKYSYRIPDGFHYDVTHVDDRPFKVRDHRFTAYPAIKGGHVNLDPHGVVRG